ncbi:MAG: right-handed parallel beta-helix repeat-containing protein [Verrucomicrobiota bacterium]
MKTFTQFALAGLSAFLWIGSTHAAVIRVVCQNNSGDAALINAAISGSVAGDEIVIDGPALISQTISLLGDRVYRGESRTGTVLKQANSANLSAVLASASYLTNSTSTGNPITVRQLTVEGNKANNTLINTIGILLRNRDSVVEDLFINSMGGNAIRLSNPSANGTGLSTSQSYGVIQNCFINSSGEHGIYVKDSGNKCVGWEIIDNWICGSGANSDAINVENGNSWIIDRNHLYGVKRHGIFVDRAYNVSVSDNYIEGFGESTTVGSYFGIGLALNGDVTNLIRDNRVFNFGTITAGSSYYSIRVDRVNYSAGTANVYGNVVRGGSATANTIGLSYNKGNGTALTVNYKGNQVSNVQTPRSAGTGVTIVSQNSGL